MKLITATTVTEQFRQRYAFMRMVDRWNHKPHLTPPYRIDVAALRKDSGVKCYLLGQELTGFEIEDEQQYFIFTLTYKYDRR